MKLLPNIHILVYVVYIFTCWISLLETGIHVNEVFYIHTLNDANDLKVRLKI